MWGKVVTLYLLLFLPEVLECTGVSPPGKPVLINCRSPEKETFTCWWEPGSDGGLTTIHQLYYQREDSDGKYECPDYQTAGKNSCYFDKSHTSIWVNYNITVVARNTLGSTVSDPAEVDVMYIVQPNTPENVTVSVVETGGSPHLLVKWEPPHGADLHSGWITLTSQLRVKRQNEKEWEEHLSGKQTQFNIYSLYPGEVYMVQVRCSLDHGFWSEWSTTTYREVPDYTLKDRSIWIVMAVFSVFIFLVVTSTLAMKRKYVKHCLLPPIPGPKITGFDTQLLKSGRSEDIHSALFNKGFPPMVVASKDQLMEDLVVFDSDEELTLDSQKGHTRKTNSLDICQLHLWIEANIKELNVDGNRQTIKRHGGQDNTQDSVEFTSGKINTVSTVIKPHPSAQNSVTDVPQQGLVSSKYLSSSYHKDLWENASGKHTNYRGMAVRRQSKCDNELNIDHNTENVVPSSRVSGYVDVQRQKESIQVPVPEMDESQEDYSKVSGVDSDNVLLLQRDIVPLDSTSTCKEVGNQAKCSYWRPSKPHIAMPTKEGVHIDLNGYVETSSAIL